jgi:hypothetical protein
MNFKTRPLLIAAGASLVVQLVLIGINFVAGHPFTFTSSLSKTMLTFIVAIASLGLFLAHVLAGGLYSFLGTREGPLSIGAGAVGGAAASALARLVGTPVYLFISSGLLYPLITGEKPPAFQEFYPGLDSIELIAIAGLIIIIITVLIAAVLGAVGGAIVAAIAKLKTAPSSL